MRYREQLSEHFRLNEAACPCCGVYFPNATLLGALEELRDLLGSQPIHVTSWCRCSAWNKVVGGKSGSQHLRGTAADIVVRHRHPEEVADAAEKITVFRHGGIGVYPHRGFTHLDVRTRGPARWQE